MSKAKQSTERAVVVCTDRRGVFFGYAEDTEGDAIVLRKPRMAVYWSEDVKGVMGLAATGPTKGCKITLAPPRIEVRGVTAVIDCSPAAVDAWEAGHWS